MKYTDLFLSLEEPVAAGLFEQEDRSAYIRYCRALRRYFETLPVNYGGGFLYPSGKNESGYSITGQYYYQISEESPRLRERDPEAYQVVRRYLNEHRADGWVHGSPYYERILKEGLDSYEKRIRTRCSGDFREGLLDMLTGIRAYHARSIETLKARNASEKLIAALEQVPFQPARTLYEAIVGWNYIYYLDFNGDNAGVIDAGLEPYVQGETDAEIIAWLEEFFENVNQTEKWSTAIGAYGYTRMTSLCMEAGSRKRRPLMELMVRDDMPDAFWEQACACIFRGCGNPALYNDAAIQTMLEKCYPDAPPEDRRRFCGGGCTETTLAGLSYSGATDDNINVLKLLEDWIDAGNLNCCETFEAFYEGFRASVGEEVRRICKKIAEKYRHRAEVNPCPMKSLLYDDCIDNNTDFYAGGARYLNSCPSDSGIPNTIDALLTIQTLLYERKEYAPDDFVKLIRQEDPRIMKEIAALPHYGIDDERSDALIHDFTTYYYHCFIDRRIVLDLPNGKQRIGLFTPTAHQFLRHAYAGKQMCATADGRHAGEALSDSIGPLPGKAFRGPTALLKSVLSYEQSEIYGIPVLNLSLTRECDPMLIKALITSYFAGGGVQVQITCVNREILDDAIKNPERHGDLVVRVGGYNEYFVRLDAETRENFLKRNYYKH